jgi:hypothetical protein
VARIVEIVDVLLAVSAVLLDSVEQACKEMHAQHRDEEQADYLEGRRAEVEHRIPLDNPAPSHPTSGRSDGLAGGGRGDSRDELDELEDAGDAHDAQDLDDADHPVVVARRRRRHGRVAALHAAVRGQSISGADPLSSQDGVAGRRVTS